MSFPFQNTLSHQVSCKGTGLHTGKEVRIKMLPADEGTGILFKRTDILDADPLVYAHYKNVTDTTMCTKLSNQDGVSVSTIEHLMAAFWGCGIDNAVVEIDDCEVPIMDGSSEPFVFMLECAGTKKQSSPRRVIEVLKTIEISEDNKKCAIMPANNFSVDIEIDFGDSFVSSQQCVYSSSDISFKTDLCRARSFCFDHEVMYLKQNGLAQGGSLDNAIVVSKNGILNEGGLRYEDEFARHKVLDCIGDFSLSGAQLLGRFVGFRSGHSLNNKLLHKFFDDHTAWREIKYVDNQSFPGIVGRA